MKLLLTITWETKGNTSCRCLKVRPPAWDCVAISCSSQQCVCTYAVLQRYAVFIGVIHAGVIEGNHFTAKLYCNYGDERLLFRDTNTE